MLLLNPPVAEATPLYWRRAFPGDAAQARAVRGFVACLLDGCPSLDDVDEGGPDDPVARDADLFAESGRGLRTVSLTAMRWGWHGNASGRTVTAVFARDPREAGR